LQKGIEREFGMILYAWIPLDFVRIKIY
jgi:hypothetical protein